MARLARALGVPLMPWQALVADVAGEFDPKTGRPFYREIVVTIPRQSGKTTLILVWMLHRALTWGSNQQIAFTAQTGQDARQKIVDDFLPLIHRSRMADTVEQTWRAAADTAILFKTGSKIRALATSEEAGHGKTIDLAVIDEAMADEDDRREQALLPAMMTRPDAQQLVFSTAGTDRSLLLKRKVEAGRAAVAEGETHGIAYFEWSADPDADPDDESVWWQCMPALGITQPLEAVKHARKTMSDGEFRRAFLNQWTKSDERVIPVEVWSAVVSPTVAPQGVLRFAADASPDRSTAAIAVADENRRAELVEHRGGVGWVADRLEELVGKHGGSVVVDQTGPLASVIDDLAERGVAVTGVTARQVSNATARFFDDVVDRRVLIKYHPALETAVAGARKRPMGDAWTWARAASEADISPLVAVTLSLGQSTGPADQGFTFALLE